MLDADAGPPTDALVTVVVPAWNCAPFVEETLASIARQTESRWRLVVVDDCSTDDTPAVLARALTAIPKERWTLMRHEQNQGLAQARNTGIAASTTELVALLDSDDLWYPDFLAETLRTLRASSLDVAFARGDRVRHPGGERAHPFDPTPALIAAFPLSLMRGLDISASGVLLRRDVFARVGTFDPDPAIVEDLNFWLRVAEARLRVGWTEKRLHAVRLRAQSLASGDRRFHRKTLETWRRFIENSLYPAGEMRQAVAETALAAALGLARRDPEEALWAALQAARLAPSRMKLAQYALRRARNRARRIYSRRTGSPE